MSGGSEGSSTMLLINETAIVNEGFLEYINNLLNSGEVANLFNREEMEVIETDLRPLATR
jgi:dynein heavy chain